MTPYFSILIPAFKVSYLKECIESILAQIYKNFEVIIVDDASPYDICSIVSQFNDERIRYYRNEVGFGAYNVVGNWNKCLGFATGDYVICMGDDDMLLPEALAEYVKLIKKYPDLGLYHGLTEFIDENGELLNMQESRPEFESVYSMIWHRWTVRSHQYIGDWCFDTAVLRKNGGFFPLPLAWGSDDISAVLAAKERGVANTNTLCFLYRKNRQTISMNGSYASIKLDALKQEKKWFEAFFLNNRPQNQVDNLYYMLCMRIKDKRYEDRFIGTIFNGFVWGGSNKFELFLQGKQLGISNLKFLKIFVSYLFACVKRMLRK